MVYSTVAKTGRTPTSPRVLARRPATMVRMTKATITGFVYRPFATTRFRTALSTNVVIPANDPKKTDATARSAHSKNWQKKTACLRFTTQLATINKAAKNERMFPIIINPSASHSFGAGYRPGQSDSSDGYPAAAPGPQRLSNSFLT